MTPSEFEGSSPSADERTDGRPAGWPIWLAAAAASALWALAPIAFAIGYRAKVSPLQDDQFALAVFALLAIGPAAFVFCAAYVIRQGQMMAFEARRSQAMAEEMLSPALVAAARAGQVTQVVREEIARAGTAAEEAREAILALRDALAFETDKLTGATAQSVRTAHELSTTLGRERGEMASLSQTLDAQATRVTDAVSQQARMIADATGIAETQIREAEVGLSATAADLAAAAAAATNAARTAGEDLTRHIARLEAAGSGVAEQVTAVESGLADHRIELVSLSRTLKADHETFVANADAHSGKLSEIISSARETAQEMNEQVTVSGAIVREFVTDAAQQLRDLVETAKAEREEFGQSTQHSLEAVALAASELRDQLMRQAQESFASLSAAADESRRSAHDQVEMARDRVDQLSEAAFNAGQKANTVFEARLEEARALVEASTRMVEDASDATTVKLEAGVASARAVLDELSSMMQELEVRAERLPDLARSQVELVRAAVSQGVDELLTQARATSEEAEALEAALQLRIQDKQARQASAASPLGAEPVAEPVTGEPSIAPAVIDIGPDPRPHDPENQLSAEPDSDRGLADRIGLRNRIRLTPIASDREFSAVFEAAVGVPAPAIVAAEADDSVAGDRDPWTWKDLLASLDGGEPEAEGLASHLASELARMGVAPVTLLPQGRIEEISTTMQAGNFDSARQVVRRLAPAATRRIARRLFTDDAVKRRSVLYVQRYKTMVEEAIAKDPDGRLLESLLATDAGRTFLLFDAAAGDMI